MASKPASKPASNATSRKGSVAAVLPPTRRQIIAIDADQLKKLTIYKNGLEDKLAKGKGDASAAKKAIEAANNSIKLLGPDLAKKILAEAKEIVQEMKARSEVKLPAGATREDIIASCAKELAAELGYRKRLEGAIKLGLEVGVEVPPARAVLAKLNQTIVLMEKSLATKIQKVTGELMGEVIEELDSKRKYVFGLAKQLQEKGVPVPRETMTAIGLLTKGKHEIEADLAKVQKEVTPGVITPNQRPAPPGALITAKAGETRKK